MEFRFLEHEDYDTLCKWWKQNRFPPPPRDFLPNYGLDGIMVSKDGIEICAGFIYETSAPALAWIEFVVANFEVKDRGLRKEALNFLITELSTIAENMGKKYLYTNLKNQGLVERYKDCGYVVGSKGCVEMVKVIS